MKSKILKDGFVYDLDAAIFPFFNFEKVFHYCRISPWLSKINYTGKKALDVGCIQAFYLQKQNISNLDLRMNASKRTCPACGIPRCLQRGGVH